MGSGLYRHKRGTWSQAAEPLVNCGSGEGGGQGLVALEHDGGGSEAPGTEEGRQDESEFRGEVVGERVVQVDIAKILQVPKLKSTWKKVNGVWVRASQPVGCNDRVTENGNKDGTNIPKKVAVDTHKEELTKFTFVRNRIDSYTKIN